MFLELTLLSEPYAGRRLVLAPGQAARVGRLQRITELCVPDKFLAPVHFGLRCELSHCTVHDLSQELQKHPQCVRQCFLAELRNAQCPSIQCVAHDMSGENGVYVNRTKVTQAALQDGDVILAGSSAFQVKLSESVPPAPATPESPTPSAIPPLSLMQQEHLLATLATQSNPLYALLDAARDPDVLHTLRVHDAIYYSLYDGAEAEKLVDAAPYLVALPPDSPLTRELVKERWGHAWYTFLFSRADFKLLRRHLRKFLLVEDEGGKSMYFRFYDPRVLRAYLPTCTAQECADVFGPIAHFVVESEDRAQAAIFSFDGAGLRQEVVRF